MKTRTAKRKKSAVTVAAEMANAAKVIARKAGAASAANAAGVVAVTVRTAKAAKRVNLPGLPTMMPLIVPMMTTATKKARAHPNQTSLVKTAKVRVSGAGVVVVGAVAELAVKAAKAKARPAKTATMRPLKLLT